VFSSLFHLLFNGLSWQEEFIFASLPTTTMVPNPKENGGVLRERMDQDAVPPNGKKDAAKENLRKKGEKNKDDDLVSSCSCFNLFAYW